MKKQFIILVSLFFTTSLFAQVEQKVIIEHFTNTKCSTCASKNPALYQTLEDYPQVLHIAYHPSLPYSACIFSQHNPIENDEMTKYYGVYGATPRAVIQGEVLPIQTPLVKTEDIESRLGITSDIKLTISNSQVEGDEYKVLFEIERVNGNSNDELSAYIGLAEKAIDYNAPNGENIHHDVFRKVLYSEDIVLVSAGDKIEEEISYTMDQEWVADQIYAFIIINDPVTKEVIQTESSLSSVSSVINNGTLEQFNVLYPVPSSSVINFSSNYSESITRIELFSLTGTKVKEHRSTSALNISELPDGIYYAMIFFDDKSIITQKIIKSR